MQKSLEPTAGRGEGARWHALAEGKARLGGVRLVDWWTGGRLAHESLAE